MNSGIFTKACGFVAALLLCGCASDKVSVTAGISVINEDAIASRPVEIPEGVDVEDFRRLRMGITYGKVQSNTSAFKSKDSIDYMNLRFQSEMSKRRRFDFIALWGADKTLLDDLADINEMESDPDSGEPRYKYPSLNLNWNINIQEKKVAAGTYRQIFQWYCTVNATVSYLRDVKKANDKEIRGHKGDVAFTYDFDLPVIEKEQVLNSMGGVKSGFSYKSDADVQSLMQEIIIAASQRISDDIGQDFPVGGRVIGALGDDFFTIDKGVRQGVEKDMQMVVFARCDGVNDVPLANAVASPAQERCQLKVWRFSEDKYAKAILGQINGNPKKWTKETGNEIFAVRAVPPRDKQKGTRFE